MPPLQLAFEQRFPHWFRGARAPIARNVYSAYARFAGLPAIEDFLHANAHRQGLDFVDAALEWLDCRYLVDQVERERIPESGRVMIVANHPMGGLDALALLACVGRVRRDLRIVANDVLSSISNLAPLLLAVPTFSGPAPVARVRELVAALDADMAVIVFPAAEVSRLGLRGVRDAPWSDGFLRIARRAGAPVLPVRIHGGNSALFHAASLLFKPLGTAMLPRELRARRGARLELRVGEPCATGAIPALAGTAARSVERAVRTLGHRDDAWRAPVASIAHRPDLRRLRADLDGLAMLGETADGKRIHAGRLASDSALLRELGCLREATFREVGEGTGTRLDSDAFDTWYDHIVLWDERAQAVVGAYRAVRCRDVLRERGKAGLYTASLFDYDDALAPMLDAGVELGRSFITRDYRGTRSLDSLWYGIGAWLRGQSDIRYLFGPVSISGQLPALARDWIVGYYRRYHGVADAPARAARPFHYSTRGPDFGTLDAGAAMQLLRQQLEPLGARVPVLYRQYVELCEPGGASFLAFGVDPAFNHSVDGLIRVDLSKMTPKRRQRYLEKRG